MTDHLPPAPSGPGQPQTKERQGAPYPQRRIAAGLLVSIPLLVVVLCPLYSRASPEAFGWPFFYWFTLLWIPLTSVCSVIAWRLLDSRENR